MYRNTLRQRAAISTRNVRLLMRQQGRQTLARQASRGMAQPYKAGVPCVQGLLLLTRGACQFKQPGRETPLLSFTPNRPRSPCHEHQKAGVQLGGAYAGASEAASSLSHAAGYSHCSAPTAQLGLADSSHKKGGQELDE